MYRESSASPWLARPKAAPAAEPDDWAEPEVVPRTVGRAEMCVGNVTVTRQRERPGSVELLVRYCGPLATRGTVFVRFGERRGDREWVAPRDVLMFQGAGEAWATVVCPVDGSWRGGCLAFFAPRIGRRDEWVWDNAGRAYGYYAYDCGDDRVEER